MNRKLSKDLRDQNSRIYLSPRYIYHRLQRGRQEHLVREPMCGANVIYVQVAYKQTIHYRNKILD